LFILKHYSLFAMCSSWASTATWTKTVDTVYST